MPAIGSSGYHAGFFKFERRFAKGLTLLAHYTELDWAESCGVSRYLIRLSVGLEDPEELWRRLDDALGSV